LKNDYPLGFILNTIALRIKSLVKWKNNQTK